MKLRDLLRLPGYWHFVTDDLPPLLAFFEARLPAPRTVRRCAEMYVASVPKYAATERILRRAGLDFSGGALAAGHFSSTSERRAAEILDETVEDIVHMG